MWGQGGRAGLPICEPSHFCLCRIFEPLIFSCICFNKWFGLVLWDSTAGATPKWQSLSFSGIPNIQSHRDPNHPFSIGCCWLPQALGLICAERGKLWLGKLSSMGVDRLMCCPLSVRESTRWVDTTDFIVFGVSNFQPSLFAIKIP